MTTEERKLDCWIQAKNMVVAVAATCLVLGLYYMSHSWHSFWGLSLLAFMTLIKSDDTK